MKLKFLVVFVNKAHRHRGELDYGAYGIVCHLPEEKDSVRSFKELTYDSMEEAASARDNLAERFPDYQYKVAVIIG